MQPYHLLSIPSLTHCLKAYHFENVGNRSLRDFSQKLFAGETLKDVATVDSTQALIGISCFIDLNKQSI